MIDLEAARYLWHPIAASDDLVPRHVFHGQLLGRELAVWRADDGHVNAWENRCLHRGVRLSIGINDGTELLCQYHGWRYANRTASCTYIPAHPADAPARTICNHHFPVIEQYGLIWSGEAPEGALPSLMGMNTDFVTPLRAIPVNAPCRALALALVDTYTRTPLAERPGRLYGAHTPDPLTIILRPNQDGQSASNGEPGLVFFLQPVDAARTVVRGLLCGIDEHTASGQDLDQRLRHHNRLLSRLRDDVESALIGETAPPPWTPGFAPVSDELARMPERSTDPDNATLRVRVADIRTLSPTTRAYRLEALDTGPETALPSAQPGAHIDVHLPNALVRQYSLINGPGQTDHYAIAVKRLADSTGGSACLHDTVRIGDILATSIPRNNFTLRRDAVTTLLIAGGIGVTPLLSMARTLEHMGRDFRLHHFVSSEQEGLFPEDRASMQERWQQHVGLAPADTLDTLSSLLAEQTQDQHVYLCGPVPMLQSAREIATACGWRESQVHFEYFRNDTARDDATPFDVDLARSGLSLSVPPGRSLLSVLRENGLAIPSSCEQGACGTCRIAVIDGQPDHQDVYLTEAEKARGNCMISCVSRARSARLTLDL